MLQKNIRKEFCRMDRPKCYSNNINDTSKKFYCLNKVCNVICCVLQELCIRVILVQIVAPERYVKYLQENYLANVSHPPTLCFVHQGRMKIYMAMRQRARRNGFMILSFLINDTQMTLKFMLGLLRRLSVGNICINSFSHPIPSVLLCYLDFIQQGGWV